MGYLTSGARIDLLQWWKGAKAWQNNMQPASSLGSDLIMIGLEEYPCLADLPDQSRSQLSTSPKTKKRCAVLAGCW